MAQVKTLTFSESTKGWTSFWDYKPSFIFSINGTYFTANGSHIWQHYDELGIKNKGLFYDTQYPSEVTVVLNDNPSLPKNFKTVNYEGSNGWEASNIHTDEYSPSSNNYGNVSVKDEGLQIKSYSEGMYVDGGVEYQSGFDRKDNKYYAEIRGNGVIVREEEVLSQDETAGVKGVFCTVTLKTDQTTDTGGRKQLFSVSSEVVQSS